PPVEESRRRGVCGLSAEEQETAPVGGPDRIAGGCETVCNASGLSSGGRDSKHITRTARTGSGGPRVCPIRDAAPGRRETRPTATFCHEPRVTGKRRHDIDAASTAVRAKRDEAAVGREVRLAIIRGIIGQTNWLATGGSLKPEVELPGTRSIRRVH